WNELVAHPKWLVGFSDVTALHLEAQARGMASIHAPNVTGLGRTIDVRARAALLAALERPAAPHAWSDLAVIHAGPAIDGILAGAPFGHADRNEPFVLGARARVDGATITFLGSP